jgi:predicted N-acyltransferase
MKNIKLTEDEIFELLLSLKYCIEMKNLDTERALVDEKAGIPTQLFDNYTDYLAALEAQKDKAVRLVTKVQNQTGIRVAAFKETK